MSQFTLQSGAQEQLQQPKLVCYRVITSMPCFKKKKKKIFFSNDKTKTSTDHFSDNTELLKIN